MSEMLGNAKGDAALSIKIYRKNGDVEEMQGIGSAQVDLPNNLVEEYKLLTKRIREIESIFLDHMTGEK